MDNFSLNQIYFYLTEGCNLGCRHCWLAPKLDRTGTQQATLPVELFETVIREAKPLGLSAVKLTGGEPLLHPHISDLLAIVGRENLRLVLETNGTLCTPALAAEIAKIPKSLVSVSLDGVDAATHEWVRGIPGSFDAAVRAVRLLSGSGLHTQVIFSLMGHNKTQVKELIRLAEQLGAASVKFNIIQPTARGELLHESGAALSVSEYLEIGRRVEQELAPATKMRLFFHSPIAFRPLSLIASGDGCGRCGIKNIMGVLATGQYALCGIGEQIKELLFGDVGKDRLETIWLNSPVLNRIRNDIPARLTGVCGRCLMKGRCLGACIAQNYYRSRELTAPFWFCEEAEREGLFPASRLLNRENEFPVTDTV